MSYDRNLTQFDFSQDKPRLRMPTSLAFNESNWYSQESKIGNKTMNADVSMKQINHSKFSPKPRNQNHEIDN